MNDISRVPPRENHRVTLGRGMLETSEICIHNDNHSSGIGPDSAAPETKIIGYRILTWKLVIYLGFMGYYCLYRPRAEVGCGDIYLRETRNEPTATQEPASEHDTEPLTCTRITSTSECIPSISFSFP